VGCAVLARRLADPDSVMKIKAAIND